MRDRADRHDRHQNGQVDGLLCWIRLTAEEGGAPLDSLRQRTNWLPVYLPLFDTPVPVTAGEPAGGRVRAPDQRR